MKFALLALALALSGQTPSTTNDQVFRALSDELARIPQLQIAPMPAPFFAQYTVNECDEFKLRAVLGDLTQKVDRTDRELFPQVLVGDKSLANTNFVSGSAAPSSQPDLLPTDDDYSALRHGIWLATDKAYKSAVRTVQAKHAWLQQNRVGDRLADFQPEPPVVHIEEFPALSIDKSAWKDRVVDVSKIFADYPEIQRSRVELAVFREKRWILNTEGTRLREGELQSGVDIWTSSQAPDGEFVGDNEVIFATDPDSLPGQAALRQHVKTLAQRTVAMMHAAPGEDYVGPVIFEGQAAASLVSELLAPNLGFPVEPLGMSGSGAWRNPFANARGHRVLAPFLSVIDDPLTKSFHGQDLLGGYSYDDDGIAAQRLTLIDHGVLKALCTSRTPTRWGEHSNGHSSGGLGWPSVLTLQSDKQMSMSRLKERLIAMGKEEGLDYVILIRRIWNDYSLFEADWSAPTNAQSGYATPSSSLQPNSPIEIYKVYVQDGHQELIRDVEFRYTSLRAFRDVEATGDDAAPYEVQVSGEPLKHVISPSLLVKEIELEPKKKENTDLPLLPSPFAK